MTNAQANERWLKVVPSLQKQALHELQDSYKEFAPLGKLDKHWDRGMLDYRIVT